ncbi:unnamed protein product [Zymoseptoria tritici ST99CH_3D7]|uniref:F-box domain-containing protein n=1 Tax=Zymoseptoria tritici (strain ST99CH_3D7) TaxID=1276538 RepID=A0A1X7S461_ZYMT9|nr:unnamed protein product [Zymoseptoria tritici ST99CH_3D7]
MRSPACWTTALLALLLTGALGNTEKTIFVAPAAIILPNAGPRLADLKLDTLSSSSSSLQRPLSVAFPTEDAPQGRESWYLLQDLIEGQRYEVRVCWAAVQPTEFWLDVYNITHVFETPRLIQSLAEFAEEQTQADPRKGSVAPSDSSNPNSSLLFLHVRAAADFFSSNNTLMQHPPKVSVDIILDPYLANIFPASLLPTAAYIVVLAAAMANTDDSTQHANVGPSRGNAASAQESNQNSDPTGSGNSDGSPTTATPTARRPRHPFYTLPSELILDIVDMLPADGFINFAFANYPLLHSYGMAPALSRPRVVYITTQTQIPALFPLLRMPPEIMLHIMRHLKPIDIMRFVVANYQDLARQGIAPPLSPATVMQLRNAVRARLLGQENFQ